MYRILIVDDETIFRKGLRKMISSLDQDWEIAGEAKDGYEALEMIDRLRPDVVLTDIRMPRMDGIQLQQIVRERFPDLICIVISGYDEFYYVQQSLRVGVRDYLLKPVEREQLAQLLTTFKEELANRSEQRHLHITPREEYELQQHVREHLIAGFLRGSVHESDLELLRRIGVDFQYPYFTCMVIKLDKGSMDPERYSKFNPNLFQLFIQQFVQEMLNRKTNSFCFVWSDTEVVALVNIQEPAMVRDDLPGLADRIRKEIKAFSHFTVTIGIGSVVEGIASIPRSYNEAALSLLYRLIVGGDRVIDYGTMSGKSGMSSGFRKFSWDELEHSINEGDTERAVERVESVVTELCAHTGSPEVVLQQVCKIIIHYYELAQELGIARQWLKGQDIRALLLHICSISSREELIEQCKELFARLTQCIADGKLKIDNDPVNIAVRYMENHYHEPVTLKQVAERVFLNPAYFSTLFKQRTGKTFVERLTEIRIEEAKKRLAYTDDKIAIIAENTGFANLRHFNRVFKNETKLSPKDFRDQVRSRSTGKG